MNWDLAVQVVVPGLIIFILGWYARGKREKVLRDRQKSGAVVKNLYKSKA